MIHNKTQNSSYYFTQTIIKDYLQSHNPNWKVIWDARGHFKEPHTDLTIGIGGLEVSQYCDGWTGDNVISTNPKFGFKKMVDTIGPKNRFGAVLFIEKEGFNELLEDCNIGDEYDIAIMSTKGSPVGASCVLANKLSSYGIKIFVLHDFDFAGFKIINTLRNGTRLSPSTPDVIDVGLRLDDMDDTMLKDAEPCLHKQRKDPKIMLREYDATEEECDFLVGTQYSHYWDGKRVELNAMTSEQFINHIKKKLKKHGVKKVIPEEKVLRKGYQRAVYYQRIFKEIDRIKDDLKKDIVIPEKLNEKVEDKIKKKETWENVLWNIAEKDEK